MQPTYLPWSGYFDLINRSDKFVFLDDVQFAKRSWQQRNRIVVNGKELYLTVPVLSKGKMEQRICDVVVDDSQNWREKHMKTLELAYKKTPMGRELCDIIFDVLQSEETKISTINQKIIRNICHYLSIKTEFVNSSDLACDGAKSSKLVNICKKLGAREYLSAAGSHEYIESEGLFRLENIKVTYQNYCVRPYPQLKAQQFMPYMSFI